METSQQMSKSDTINLRRKHIGESCELFFREDPLKIVRGRGQFLYDENGEKYLDCLNNVAHVGHCDETVVRKSAEQMASLNTNNRFLHDNLVLCAQKISETMPDPLSVCFFTNSGSEANDLALRIARAYTKHKDVICMDFAYHGHLSSLIDISPYKFKAGEFPRKDWVHVAPIPDSYRGKYQGENVGPKYADDVRVIIEDATQNGRQIAAFIAESAPSCGGQIILPPNYLKNVYKHVRAAGGICIADEVQIGFGRTGTHYWAFQTQDVIPDIVTIGKSMGNGHPIAAIVTSEKIARSFVDLGMEYFNTYGGNPVSCAATLAVMEVIERDGLIENARDVGNYVLAKMNELKSKYDIIGDVRGLGLFIGIELVNDRATKEPATKQANIIKAKLRDRRVLMSTDGPDRNVLKFKPPMIFTKNDADHLINVLNIIFSEIK